RLPHREIAGGGAPLRADIGGGEVLDEEPGGELLLRRVRLEEGDVAAVARRHGATGGAALRDDRDVPVELGPAIDHALVEGEASGRTHGEDDLALAEGVLVVVRLGD